MTTLFAIRKKGLQEVQRLNKEIQKQHARIEHRTRVWRTEGIPTSPEKRQRMAERLHELMTLRNIESSAADAVWHKILELKGFANWQFSDLMLANLTLLCEAQGLHGLVKEARKLTKKQCSADVASHAGKVKVKRDTTTCAEFLDAMEE